MSDHHCSRRAFIAAGSLGVAVVSHLLAEEAPVEESFPEHATAALERLLAGNKRFVAGQTRHAHEGANWRRHLVGGQRPIATILSCSDSRVPPELVFDQGFGDLFIVRVAGNVVAPDVIGSIRYAIMHLGTPLLVVMGHTGCGAITAALEHRRQGSLAAGPIAYLLNLIDPALEQLPQGASAGTTLTAAVEANVKWSVKQLSNEADTNMDLLAGQIQVVGAVYDLQSGVVKLL